MLSDLKLLKILKNMLGWVVRWVKVKSNTNETYLIREVDLNSEIRTENKLLDIFSFKLLDK